MLSKRKVRWIAFTIAASLWALDAYSAGFIEYYQNNLRVTLHNHLSFLFVGWQGDFHYTLDLAGIYWFPTYHIGISLIFYPLITTLFLSYAIFLTIGDTLKSLKGKKVKSRVTGKLSFSIFTSTIATGSCCTFPIIYYLIALFLTSSASLSFDIYLSFYSYLIDTLIAVFLIWLHKRNVNRNPLNFDLYADKQ